MMLFLHSQVKTNPVSAEAPAERQPRRNEENEGFSGLLPIPRLFLVVFHSFFIRLYRGFATRHEGHYEDALIDSPARAAAARTAGPDP
jgi:hypothetical protein